MLRLLGISVEPALDQGPRPRARLLLADEPTAEFDATARALVLLLVTGVAASGESAVVIATHDPEVASTCQRTIDLSKPG